MERLKHWTRLLQKRSTQIVGSIFLQEGPHAVTLLVLKPDWSGVGTPYVNINGAASRGFRLQHYGSSLGVTARVSAGEQVS